uniref:Uncharacterized protein n=1 Tax=Populus trichocarpa TaxID=3694 RepID=A0A2K2B1N6_POPTR
MVGYNLISLSPNSILDHTDLDSKCLGLVLVNSMCLGLNLRLLRSKIILILDSPKFNPKLVLSLTLDVWT